MTRNSEHKSTNGSRLSNGATTNGNGVHTSSVLNGNHFTNGGTAHVSNQRASETSISISTQILRAVSTLFLLTMTPNLIMWIWYAIKYHNGSYQEFAAAALNSPNPFRFFIDVWMEACSGFSFSISLIGTYMVFQLILMKFVPGPEVRGPTTPTGHIPIYTDNGYRIYWITMSTFAILTYYLKMYTAYSPSIVFDNFGSILVTLTLFSSVLCMFLYMKGIYWPSSKDAGASGNLPFDYYWGTELYPRILGYDIKVFTNCRVGCTVWAILPCCFAMKSYEMHGFEGSINIFVSLVILLVYLTKFFWWEAGYMCTMDIILDRAGYYICWGCLCWIPGLYTAFSHYMVTHPIAMGYPLASLNLIAGVFCVLINYFADWERQKVRNSNGQGLLWGKKPRIIKAKYTTSEGKEKTSILLASGTWGFARHFHYLPEIGAAFLWSAPAGFSHILPYSYLIFLVLLLIHRTYRDDIKCSAKYGKYWQEYKKLVPYRIIPYVF